MNIKKEFVEYLRSYYGADVLTMESGFPPLDVGPNYPAFRESQDMNDMLGALGGMEGPPGMGAPMLGGGPPMGLPQEVGGPRDIRDAENLLL